jgi:hypothetical protein
MVARAVAETLVAAACSDCVVATVDQNNVPRLSCGDIREGQGNRTRRCAEEVIRGVHVERTIVVCCNGSPL